MEKVLISKNTTLFFILFVLGTLLAYFSRHVLIISVIGLGFGVLINPLFNILRKKLRLPRALSALVVLVGLIVIFGAVSWSLYFLIADQVQSLKERWPVLQVQITEGTAHMTKRYPWIQQQVESFDFGSYLSQSARGLMQGFKAGAVALSGAVFAIVIGLYTALNGNDYFEKTVEAFYPRYREKATRVMSHCAQVIRSWFKAQLIDMVIIGFLTGTGLWIVGVEYWAVFGLLTAVLGIIPYVGIILVVTAASIITLASDPSKVPWVLGIFALTQQLEGDVILPMVMKGGADLPVVPLLIFMLFLGTFFGIVGVFIAPPLLAILRVLYIDLYLPGIESVSENASSPIRE